MITMTKSGYRAFCKDIETKPFSYPSLELEPIINKQPAYFIGWAIWCLQGLPVPQNEEEQQVHNMLKNFLDKNLKIIEG